MKFILDAHENTVSVIVRVHPVSECIGEGLRKQFARVARTLKKYIDGKFKVPQKIVIYHGYKSENKHLLYKKKNAPDDWVLESYDY